MILVNKFVFNGFWIDRIRIMFRVEFIFWILIFVSSFFTFHQILNNDRIILIDSRIGGFHFLEFNFFGNVVYLRLRLSHKRRRLVFIIGARVAVLIFSVVARIPFGYFKTVLVEHLLECLVGQQVVNVVVLHPQIHSVQILLVFLECVVQLEDRRFPSSVRRHRVDFVFIFVTLTFRLTIVFILVLLIRSYGFRF